MSTTKTTDIPITNLKGNVMQKLAGKYMPLIILSSAIISSFWNADGKGVVFVITAIIVTTIFSGFASKISKNVTLSPSYCSMDMGLQNWSILTNDTQSILMGYTIGYIMSCLIGVWGAVDIYKKITITILVVASSLFNLFIRANVVGMMMKGDVNHCISWKRWLGTFIFGAVGGVGIILILEAFTKSSVKKHILYNFGAGNGRSKSDKNPYYYCTDQNA
jgi:hypothetical protein